MKKSEFFTGSKEMYKTSEVEHSRDSKLLTLKGLKTFISRCAFKDDDVYVYEVKFIRKVKFSDLIKEKEQINEQSVY
jgi:hypothetical protein